MCLLMSFSQRIVYEYRSAHVSNIHPEDQLREGYKRFYRLIVPRIRSLTPKRLDVCRFFDSVFIRNR